jgi:hypothetical protein
MPAEERRRLQRIHLRPPMPGDLSGMPVFVSALSLLGAGFTHKNRFSHYQRLVFTLPHGDRKIVAECELAQSRIVPGNAPGGSQYHSGLRYVSMSDESDAVLRDLIASYVMRALQEQKANAGGVGTMDSYLFRSVAGNRYRRCEFVDGAWRKTETIDMSQPENGFTISAEIDPFQVDILCSTWENATPEGRRLTQMLAGLSMRGFEGLINERYEP